MMTTDIHTKEFKLNRSYQLLLLTCITLFAVALRLYQLGTWSFWGDELITVERVNYGFVYNGVFLKSVSTVLTALSLMFFETSEWAARLPAALVGAASIPLLYFPTRRIVGPSVALLGGLLLAVSPWHLYWSQNARFYVVLLLFYMLSLFAFYIAIEEDRPVYLFLSLFFLGLAILERLSALLIMPVIVAYLFCIVVFPFEKPRGLRWRNIFLYFSPGLVGGLVFAFPFLRDPSMWWATMAWINNNPLWLLAGVVFYVGIPTICIGGLAGLYLLTKRDRGALLLLLGAIVPLAAVMVISLVQYTANRYVFITLPCWLLLAAWGAQEIVRQAQKQAKLLAVGVFAILFLAPMGDNFLYYQYQNGNRDDWKAAYAYIEQRKEPGDLVVVPIRSLGEYYLREEVTKLDVIEVGELEAANTRVWFVEHNDTATKWPDKLAWIHENAIQVAQMDVHVQARTYKMRVYLYDPYYLPAERLVTKKP